MKKLLAILLAAVMLLSVAAFAEGQTEITLWTYPIGSWGNAEVVDGIVANFNKVHPEITVKVEYLDYTNGDKQVAAAIEAGTMPDIIMEGPERLVANWGANGKMLDLSDLWTEEAKADIIAAAPAVEAACRNAKGVYYEYPLCMTTHCMVINKTDFEAANALQYLNEETRTWTTEGFINALKALKEAGFAPTMTVYCGGQGGDQGTRALVTNLYSAQFTAADHSAYTIDSEAGIKGIQTLVDLFNEEIIDAGLDIVASDEIALFCNSTTSMSICWNASAALSNKANFAEDVVPLPMAFPSDDGVPELQGGIWGFGLFDTGNEAKVAAAKEFVRFVCDDPEQVKESVYASGFFPVKASVGDVYAGTEKEGNAEFAVFMPYLGDYYQVTGGWAQQRTEWWNMLQRVFLGGDVATEVGVYVTNSNAGIQ
ncbi:MAG TPA: extracellular solute-binding protein [Clostridiales bacterium]|jgi:multiple sugar transport system substrate-binding protein|nr:extracellular solute-binding protein [Clostridiales bacterium]